MLGNHLPQAGFVLEKRGHIDHEGVPNPPLEVGEGPVEGDGGDLAGDDVHVDTGDDGNRLTPGIFPEHRFYSLNQGQTGKLETLDDVKEGTIS